MQLRLPPPASQGPGDRASKRAREMKSLGISTPPPYSPLSLSSHSSPAAPFISLPSFRLQIPAPKPLLRPLSCSLHKTPTPQDPTPPKPPSPHSLPSLFRPVAVSLAVAASLLVARFQSPAAFAVPTPPTATVEPMKEDSVSEKEEKTLEEYSDAHPEDVAGLKALMEVKIKLQKIQEAIDVLERLIVLEPGEKEWPLLRAHLFLYSGDVDTAVLLFEEIVAADPFRVEAYHGLAMATSQSDSDKLESLLKRIHAAMDKCKKEKKEDFTDFKLLVAQIRVIEGKYEEALRLYRELVKEDPRDFRPYLCQGIIYTLLRKLDEAEKQFEKYKRLVPKEHPYARYFDDNVLTTKVFSQLRENEKMGSR